MWLYSDRFFLFVFVFVTTRYLSVLPQRWSICSSPLSVSCLQQPMFRFSKQGRVPLYSDRFSPVIFVPYIPRDLSVLPQSCSICSNPLFVRSLQSLMFRFSKQDRVPLYSDRFSTVIFAPDTSRDLSVFPQSCSNCSNPLFVSWLQQMSRFSKQGRVPLYSDRFSPVIFVSDKAEVSAAVLCLWVDCNSCIYRFSKQSRQTDSLQLYLFLIYPGI